MLVSPDLIQKMAPLDLKARQIVEGFISGLHKSPYHGFSIEFAEHRPYNQGDEIKHVDWKVFGKSERLYVKQYEEETNLKAHIVLDVSTSMRFKYHAAWTKLEYGVHLAAALMFLMHRQRDASGLFLFDEELVDALPPKATTIHLRRMYGLLDQQLKALQNPPKRKRKTQAAQVLHRLAETLGQRSLVVLISDLFEDPQQVESLKQALRHLRHNKHEVLVFNLIEARAERKLDVKGDRLQLFDLESDSSLFVDAAQIRSDYQEKIQTYIRNIRVFCDHHQIAMEEVDTESSFDVALLSYLIKRRKLG